MKKGIITLILSLLLLVPNLLQAASTATNGAFRCNGRIIKLGDSKNKVLRYCGEPDIAYDIGYATSGSSRSKVRIRRGSATVNTRYEDVTFTAEEWEYNFGAHKFIKVLIFTGGILTSIRNDDYGF